LQEGLQQREEIWFRDFVREQEAEQVGERMEQNFRLGDGE
jgi:hypothetical protein